MLFSAFWGLYFSDIRRFPRPFLASRRVSRQKLFRILSVSRARSCFSQLTGALRSFRIPSLFILTLDLALRSIVRLGEVALEVLTALRLRSIGHNRDKVASIGGVGGVVLIKAAKSSQATHDAMRCRGFEGEYDVAQSVKFGWVDAIWIALVALLFALFLYLQGQV